MKELINIKNKETECFSWYHIRHVNQAGKDFQRNKKSDRKIVEKLDYKDNKFPFTPKICLKNTNKKWYQDSRYSKKKKSTRDI